MSFKHDGTIKFLNGDTVDTVITIDSIGQFIGMPPKVYQQFIEQLNDYLGVTMQSVPMIKGSKFNRVLFPQNNCANVAMKNHEFPLEFTLNNPNGEVIFKIVL